MRLNDSGKKAPEPSQSKLLVQALEARFRQRNLTMTSWITALPAIVVIVGALISFAKVVQAHLGGGEQRETLSPVQPSACSKRPTPQDLYPRGGQVSVGTRNLLHR